jgi:protein-S-isoprenylcysteine O-methyltransferase Ste14
MRIYSAAIGLSWVVFVLVWIVFAFTSRGGGTRRYSSTGTALRLLILLLLFVALRYGDRLPPELIRPVSGPVGAVGALLCVAGVAFAVWARAALGRSWGMPMTVRDQTELVVSGPYAYVRHPIYTGVSAMLIGTALVHPIAWLTAVILIAYFLFSAGREEDDMQRQFPETYPGYKHRTKKLVPFVF